MRAGAIVTADTRTFIVLGDIGRDVIIAPVTAPRTPSRAGDVALPSGAIARVGSAYRTAPQSWLTVGVLGGEIVASCVRAMRRIQDTALLTRRHAPLGEYAIDG